MNASALNNISTTLSELSVTPAQLTTLGLSSTATLGDALTAIDEKIPDLFDEKVAKRQMITVYNPSNTELTTIWFNWNWAPVLFIANAPSIGYVIVGGGNDEIGGSGKCLLCTGSNRSAIVNYQINMEKKTLTISGVSSTINKQFYFALFF